MGELCNVHTVQYLHCVGIRPDLQGVEVIEVARDVVLWILAVIGQAAEQEHLEGDTAGVQWDTTGEILYTWSTILGVLLGVPYGVSYKYVTLFPMSVKLCPSLGQGCGPFRGGFGFNFFHSHLSVECGIVVCRCGIIVCRCGIIVCRCEIIASRCGIVVCRY